MSVRTTIFSGRSAVASTVALAAALTTVPLSAQAVDSTAEATSVQPSTESAGSVTTIRSEFEIPPLVTESQALLCPSSHPWLKRFKAGGDGLLVANDLAPDRRGNPGGVRVTAEPVIEFVSIGGYNEKRVDLWGASWRVYRGVVARAWSWNLGGPERYALELECVADPVDGAIDDPQRL